MPVLNKLSHIALVYGPIVLFSIAVFLIAELVIRGVAKRRQELGTINARLHMRATTDDPEATLVELRRQRGLDADGNYGLPLVAFNRLLLQSGVTLRPAYLMTYMVLAGSVAGLVAFKLTAALLMTLLAVFAAGGILPILWLARRRRQRIRRLEEQLPEAIDIVVRSLRAGHPVRVAISMVARELPDPIGSEFGMCFDEMTYGLDLETAMGNMRVRSGQSDLALVVIAISIQAKSGGNLAEILSKLSRMIRERAKMRRKVHALSSEGRFSAVALSVIPLALGLVIMLRAPTYFTDVKNDPLFMPAVYFGLVLWAIGALTMRRMVNFKF